MTYFLERFTYHHRIQLILQIERILPFEQLMLVEIAQIPVDNRRLYETSAFQSLSTLHLPLRDRLVLLLDVEAAVVGLVDVHQLRRVMVVVMVNMVIGMWLLRLRIAVLVVQNRTFHAVLPDLLLLRELPMSEDRFLRHRGQVGGGVKVFVGKVDHFLRLHPLAVHVVEALQVDYLQQFVFSISTMCLLFVYFVKESSLELGAAARFAASWWLVVCLCSSSSGTWSPVSLRT